MKANEFRIGNLVYGVSERIEKITAINGDLVKTNLLKIDAESQFLYSFDIEPILLTEEWLLKFGFEEDGVWIQKIKNIEHNRMLGIDLFNNHIFLAQYDTHNHFRDVFIKKCEYVHELQNLFFCLSGKELTLINT